MKYSATKGKLLNHKKKRHGKRFKLLSEKKKDNMKRLYCKLQDFNSMTFLKEKMETVE